MFVWKPLNELHAMSGKLKTMTDNIFFYKGGVTHEQYLNLILYFTHYLHLTKFEIQ